MSNTRRLYTNDRGVSNTPPASMPASINSSSRRLGGGGGGGSGGAGEGGGIHRVRRGSVSPSPAVSRSRSTSARALQRPESPMLRATSMSTSPATSAAASAAGGGGGRQRPHSRSRPLSRSRANVQAATTAAAAAVTPTSTSAAARPSKNAPPPPPNTNGSPDAAGVGMGVPKSFEGGSGGGNGGGGNGAGGLHDLALRARWSDMRSLLRLHFPSTITTFAATTTTTTTMTTTTRSPCMDGKGGDDTNVNNQNGGDMTLFFTVHDSSYSKNNKVNSASVDTEVTSPESHASSDLSGGKATGGVDGSNNKGIGHDDDNDDDDDEDDGDVGNVMIQRGGNVIAPKRRHSASFKKYSSASATASASTCKPSPTHPKQMPTASTTTTSRLVREMTTPFGTQGRTPLLMCCATKAPPDVIALLIQCNPRACAVPDRGGSLPLHFAASFCGRNGGVKGDNIGNDEDDDENDDDDDDDDDNDDDNEDDNNVDDDDNNNNKNENDMEEEKTCVVLRMLMEPFPESVCARNGIGQTPLHSYFAVKGDEGGKEGSTSTWNSKSEESLTAAVKGGRGRGRRQQQQQQQRRRRRRKRRRKRYGAGVRVVQTLLGLINPLQLPANAKNDRNDGGGRIDKANADVDADVDVDTDAGAVALRARSMHDARIRQCALIALSTPDAMGRLPLHAAAASGGGALVRRVSGGKGGGGGGSDSTRYRMCYASQELMLRLLVECLPDAATVADAGGDLPVHLLWNWGSDVGAARAVPWGSRDDDDDDDDDENEGGGKARRGGAVSPGAIEALLVPLARRPIVPSEDDVCEEESDDKVGDHDKPASRSSNGDAIDARAGKTGLVPSLRRPGRGRGRGRRPSPLHPLPPPRTHDDLRRRVDSVLRRQEEIELERTRAELRGRSAAAAAAMAAAESESTNVSVAAVSSGNDGPSGRRQRSGLPSLPSARNGGGGDGGGSSAETGDGETGGGGGRRKKREGGGGGTGTDDAAGGTATTAVSSSSFWGGEYSAGAIMSFPSSSSSSSSSLGPLAVAATACQLPGSLALPGEDGSPGMVNLPVHIAAEYGARMDVLRGIVENHPLGVAVPRSVRPDDVGYFDDDDDDVVEGMSMVKAIFPLELFETGRAGREAAKAADRIRKGSPSPQDLHELMSTLREFVERSDLLFAYHPGAVPSGYVADGRRSGGGNGNGGKVQLYRRDPDRLARFESSIRSDALDRSAPSLSPTNSLVWRWMCSYADPSDVRDHYGGSIGRILSGMDAEALWKLSVCPDPIRPAPFFLPPASMMTAVGDIPKGGDGDADLALMGTVVKLRNGRTVPIEFSARSPVATMETILRHSRWQNTLMSHLAAEDALNYSVTCRWARAAGVRLLDEAYVDLPDGTWEFGGSGMDTVPRPWQKLDGVLVTPGCTHTIFLMYDLEVDSPAGTEASGGLLVVWDDGGGAEAKPNSRPPWGDAVVASTYQSGRRYRPGDEVRLRFQHVPGRTYSLWYHGPPQISGRGMTIVSVQNVRVRQLVHASDSRGRTPLHALLGSKGPDVPAVSRLRLHVNLLLRARFGSAHPGDAVGDVPLHYALKCGVSEEVLRALISADPGSLLETDREGRTPLHAAFLLSRGEPPSPGIIRTLLSTPGENATKLKDSSVRLPLHIAAERGAGEAILGLLVDAYPDGCYRQNKDGDLPVHLMARSGRATPAAIELLIRPIMSSETMCRMPGGDGSVDLPLHIAAEYQCCYKVLETLLATYGEAACRPRMVRAGQSGQKSAAANQGGEYALDLFERQRSFVENSSPGEGRAAQRTPSIGVLSLSSQGKASSAHSILSVEGISTPSPPLDGRCRSNPTGESRASLADMAKHDVLLADFDLRSDLLFVYNPLLTPPGSYTPYRKDPKRIRRLTTLVRREAIQCADARVRGGGQSKVVSGLSEMARRAWCFLTCFEHPDDPDDHYADAVRRILKGLPTPVVNVLARVPNPRSRPQPDIPVQECAHPVCGHVLLSRIRFVGRYVLRGEDGHPVHKSDSCLVVRALDFGAVEEFRRVEKVLKSDDEANAPVDVDDLGSTGGTITHGSPGDDMEALMSAFVTFAAKIGVREIEARREIMRALGGKLPSLSGLNDDTASVSDLGDEDFAYCDRESPGTLGEEDGPHVLDARAAARKRNRELYRGAFRDFCRDHQVDAEGIRSVVIKFMMHRRQFWREKSCRVALQRSATARAEAQGEFGEFREEVGPVEDGESDWSLVPVIEDYDVDRIGERRHRADDGSFGSLSRDDDGDAVSPASKHDYPDDKDELYALDIREKNASIHNFSLYRYALVMPAGDRDLSEICMHEELGILQIREYMLQVAVALKRLHDHSVIHGDLKMENIVRFGTRVALIDLDSACRLAAPYCGKKSKTVGPSVDGTLENMGAGSHKFSTGILPPEMIARIDIGTHQRLLAQYEDYWRRISEDAKDLLLLTPDDVQTITTVIKSLLAKSDAARKMGPSATSLRYNMGERLALLENLDRDWKDILSLALITISFEDLPLSLTQCGTVEDFAAVWARLQANSRLWDKVKPRMSPDGKFAYVVKTFDDFKEERRQRRRLSGERRDNTEDDLSTLPYKLVAPTEKMDVWAFGALLYSLCSGGSLFHVGFRGDLRSSAAFADLHGWTSANAEKFIHTNVADPLAQDLLLKVLVPENERLPTMDAVLRHPFFGPSSGLEAQRILERHEEQQLILEETVVISKLTTESQRRMEFSTEKQCKIVFDEDKIVVPTCLMVLPYQMVHIDTIDGAFVAVPNDRQSLNRAVEIGKHLLDINTATARLSFWLMMKKNLADKDGSEFKSKMKTWLKRARSEASDIVAREIVAAIGCGSEYIGLCMEMLEKGDAISNARAYIKDPMTAARMAIKASTDALLQCYSSQYVYLLDEFRGAPVISENSGDEGSVGRSVKTVNGTYPLRIDPGANLLQHLLLPFMNITVMTVIAVDRMRGLARALGLHPSYGIPERWRESEPGLVHRGDKPASIAEFAVLHDVIRKRERRAALRGAQSESQITGMSFEDDVSSNATGSKSGQASLASENDGVSEMRQLEMFFRDYDSMRIFSDLRRVCDGGDKGLAIWTTEKIIDRMQGEVELAKIETRLRVIKKEVAEKERLMDEMSMLNHRVRMAREPNSAARAPDTNGTDLIPRQPDARIARRPEESATRLVRDAATSSQHRAIDYVNPNSTLAPPRPGASVLATRQSEKKRKKMRKSNKGKPKLKILPYFGVC